MTDLLPALFLLCLLAALALWWLARRGRSAQGLPQGRIVSADMGTWRRSERPLFSRAHLLAGKPDYLVQDGRALIPVEVKSRAAPAAPYLSHVMQLAAYCLLVEEALEAPAPYGLIHYRDRTFRVEFDQSLRAELLSLLEEMRDAQRAADVRRSHNEPTRCARCGYREDCGEALPTTAQPPENRIRRQ